MSKTNDQKLRDFIKKILEGEARTIVGYHHGKVDETTGRVQILDMEAGAGYNWRQVDPRTLNWAIISGTKYTVK